MSKNYNKHYQLTKEEKEKIDLAEVIGSIASLGFLIYAFIQISKIF